MTTTQIAERLLKKSQGVAETLYPLAVKGVLNEAIPTYNQVSPTNIWTDAALIPSTPPVLSNLQTSGVVMYYQKLQLVATDLQTTVAFNGTE